MVVEPLVFYVCAKCKGKSLSFHMVSGGRIICHPCDADRRKFIEQHQTQNAPG